MRRRPSRSTIASHQGAAIESSTRPKRPGPRQFGAAVPEDFRSWSPTGRGSAGRPSRERAPARDWRRVELGDDVVAEVARRAKARRQARQEVRRGMLGRVRISRPRRPAWLEAWGRLSLRDHLIATVAVVAVVAGLAVMNLPWLKVQRVEVEGSSVVSANQLLQESGARLGASTLSLDTKRLTANLLSQPWVSAASVKVRWPGTLVISVRPLPPVLVYQQGSASVLLAASGAVLGVAPPTAADLPILVNQQVGRPPHPGQVAVPGRLTAALAALYPACVAAYTVACAEFILSPVGALEIKSAAGWVADLGPALTTGQIGSLGPKLEALRTLAARINLKSPSIKEIYLENPSQVEVSP
jgi:cell division septal protein FtsQ